MGVCWYCHWGWPKPVADIYDEALKLLHGDEAPLRFGPAHMVWEDENFDNRSVNWCLEEFDNGARKWRNRFPLSDLAVVQRSLEKLSAVPEFNRCPRPDYDDENPEDFPPPPGMEMVRR